MSFVSPTTTADKLLDNMTTAVVALDDALNIKSLNPAAEQLLGISANRSIGRRLGQVVAIPDSLFARLSEAVDTHQPINDRQVTLEPLGRSPILVDCSIAPYIDDSGREGLLIEIDALDRSLRIVRDDALAAQQESVKSLLRGLAHEIKNPLGGLRGAAQLLEKQLDDDDLAEYTSIIIQEADRLHTLIDRMLGPSSRPRRDEINIHEVLEHVRKISIAGASADVTFAMDYDPSIPEFLHPLVAKVSIQDDGPGIPEALKDQVFYPMVSGRSDGSGLGLSIAQSIMGQLGGLIECSSEPSNTVFTTYIPMELT